MWLIYPLLFLAGFIDAIAGGGGLISLTSYLALGVTPHLALGTNKFSAFLGTGLSAAYFARKRAVQWNVAGYALLGALFGSACGARLALLVDEKTLSLILLVAIPAVAAFLVLRKDSNRGEKRFSPAGTTVRALLVGLGIGCYDGFIGPGTGTFLILAFTLVMGQDLLIACGNTKVVNFGSNIAAVVLFMHSGSIDYRLGIPCALCSIAGNYLGAHLAIKNGISIVRPMMIFVIALLLAKTAWDFMHG